jgi:hypothetical protein
MSRQQISDNQSVQPQSSEQPREFGTWLTTADAREFLQLKSVKSTYEWFRNHAIVRRGDKRVSRFDLERELKRLARRPRRQLHANSLANLRKRSA